MVAGEETLVLLSNRIPGQHNTVHDAFTHAYARETWMMRARVSSPLGHSAGAASNREKRETNGPEKKSKRGGGGLVDLGLACEYHKQRASFFGALFRGKQRWCTGEKREAHVSIQV